MKLYWNVLRAEGAAAVARRFAERWAESRRRRSFAADRGAPARVPLLNLVGSPLARRLGGVPIQLLDRLEVEARDRAVAVLSVRADCHIVEVDAGPARFALRYERRSPASPFEPDATLEQAIEAAAARLDTRVVHCEGLAGLTLESLRRLAARGFRWVLSIHDFALFCARPHLLEVSAPPRFCGYCVETPRCESCLRSSWPEHAGRLRSHRDAAVELLSSAEAVVFASEFLRAEHRRLFPAARPRRALVVEPGLSGLPDEASVQGVTRPRHLALLGSVTTLKGGDAFAEIVQSLGDARPPDLRLSTFGGGDSGILRRLRGLGVKVHGYHRAGSLARRLRDEGVDLALSLSIVPEAFGLTVSESWAAGVPVLAFDHGSVAERIRALGGGIVAGPEIDAQAALGVLRPLLAGELTIAPARVPLPTAAAAAARLRSLYDDLGLRT